MGPIGTKLPKAKALLDGKSVTSKAGQQETAKQVHGNMCSLVQNDAVSISVYMIFRGCYLFHGDPR